MPPIGWPIGGRANIEELPIQILIFITLILVGLYFTFFPRLALNIMKNIRDFNFKLNGYYKPRFLQIIITILIGISSFIMSLIYNRYFL